MMNRWVTIWRVMVAGTRNFTRNAWLSIAATAVMVVTLTVMLSAIIFNSALNDALKDVTRKIDITIFFNEEATQQNIDDIQAELEKIDNVQTVHFVSKS